MTSESDVPLLSFELAVDRPLSSRLDTMIARNYNAEKINTGVCDFLVVIGSDLGLRVLSNRVTHHVSPCSSLDVWFRF